MLSQTTTVVLDAFRKYHLMLMLHPTIPVEDNAIFLLFDEHASMRGVGADGWMYLSSKHGEMRACHYSRQHEVDVYNTAGAVKLYKIIGN